METIKRSIGLGGEYPVESGQEPVSGEIGQGTATEPYDSGNLPEAERGGLAPQHTPVNGEPTAATEALSSSGRSDPARDSDQIPDPTRQESREKVVNGLSEGAVGSGQRPEIGSPTWFSTAVPADQRTTNTNGAPDQRLQDQAALGGTSTDGATGAGIGTGTDTVAGTADTARVDKSLEDKTVSTDELPPNQIGDDAPPGQSQYVERTNAHSPSGAGGAAATDNAVDSAGDGGLPSSQLPGSKAAAPPVEKPDYSNAPLKPVEGTQHRRSSIPTAGGVAVGSVASEAREERRRSVDARRKSRETGSSVDRPGSGSIPEEQVPALPTQTQTDPSATTAAAPEAAAAPTTTSTTTSEPAQQESNAGGAPTTELPVDPSPRTSISQAKPTTAEVVPVNGGVSDGTAIPSQAPVASEPESKAATSPEGATETTKEGRRKSFFGKIKEKLKN